MAYSLKQAAEATGKTKPTVLRAIQTGKISGKKNELGEWEIEPAELHRVYLPVTESDTRTATQEEDEIAIEVLLLRQELAAKDERFAMLQEERERERGQLTERIGELREMLAKAEQERREKDRQLTALLTDQSTKHGREEPPTPAPSRRFLGFLPLWRRPSGLRQ
jgi:hypothetical protein